MSVLDTSGESDKHVQTMRAAAVQAAATVHNGFSPSNDIEIVALFDLADTIEKYIRNGEKPSASKPALPRITKG